MEKTQQFLIPISIVVAGVLIAGGIFFGGGGKSDVAQNGQTAPKVDVKDFDISRDPFIGNPKAKLTMIYWSDFNCGYCHQFESQALQDIIKTYVATDKVKLVFKDFQFLGANSVTTGMFARAIWDTHPANYLEWREKYSSEQGSSATFGDEASIIAMTRTLLNIDTDKVVETYNAKKTEYQALLQADMTEAQNIGLGGTPAFVIGKQVTSGALPFAAFQQIIDAEL